jgi:hypothetical protein
VNGCDKELVVRIEGVDEFLVSLSKIYLIVDWQKIYA